MEKAINKVFTGLNEAAQKSMDAAKAGKLVDSAAFATGSMPFSFQLDSNGQYTLTKSVYGAGITVNGSFVINDPAASYNITITSSTGGGGQWNNVQANQQVPFTIKTSFWSKTTLTITLQASVTNQSGDGTISYSY